MDALERLAAIGRDCACVVGNPHTNEFRIIRLDSLPLEPQTRNEFAERGFQFLAIFAKLGADELAIEAEPNIDEQTARLIFRAIVSYACVPRPLGSRRNDSVDWLKRLYSLNDDRSEAQ